MQSRSFSIAMDLNTWLLFCLTEIILCLSPGPAVLYVLSQGLSKGFKPSLAANGGIVFGNTIYFILSATSIGALLIASPNIFIVIKWAGIAWLVWLGLKLLLSKPSNLQVKHADILNLYKIFQGGVFLQLANPKNIVFFMAILPQFINLEKSVPMQVFILGVSSITIEISCLLVYGTLGSRIESWAKDRADDTSKYLNYFSGISLVGIAIGLGFTNQ